MNKTKLWMIAAILLLSCTGRQSKPPVGDLFDETNLSEGEKMIKEALDNYDMGRMMELADSLKEAGAISAVTANYYYGGAATNRGMLKVAEKHLKEATANSNPDPADLRLYLKARALLSRILTTEGDFEGALKEAIPTLAMMDSLGCKDYGDMSQLHIAIGLMLQCYIVIMLEFEIR
jgi:tetratricopeptide (TPR) repeat protein